MKHNVYLIAYKAPNGTIQVEYIEAISQRDAINKFYEYNPNCDTIYAITKIEDTWV